MKIKQALFTAGYSSFYFDDQQAIKNGAGHDGFFYTGEPVTQGFNAVRQAGECVSVQLILENGAVAVGDCAAVQYSGAGGRDPLFLAEHFIPFLNDHIKPLLVGRDVDTFLPNARFFDKPEDVPTQAYTMGIGTIMRAKRILLIASGKDKAAIVKEALFGPVRPQVPASILQLHPDVTVVLDEEAASCL